MKVDVKSFSLQEIIGEVLKGDFQLPEFQRDYVWNNPNKKALFESIFNGYPIGSLLLLQLDERNPLFAWSTLNSIDISDPRKIYRKKPDKTPPRYLILDGQQRLTSLSQIILNSVDTKSYFLRTNQIFDSWLQNGKPLGSEQITEWIDEKITFSDYLSDSKHNMNPLGRFKEKKHWISLTILQSREIYESEKNAALLLTTDNLAKLKNRLAEKRSTLTPAKLEDLERQITRTDEWRTFFSSVLHYFFKNFFEYTIPCVIVPKEMSIQGVCKIFTTTNTRGIKLGAFDLCIATLYPQDVPLKQLFDKAMTEFDLLRALDQNDKRYILQYLALHNGFNPKTASLPKNLKKDHFGDDFTVWDTRLEELDRALKSLDKYCGSSLISGNNKCLSYSPLVPPAGIVLTKFPINDELSAQQKALRKDKLTSWYFSAAISNRYGEGSDNKQERDVSEILNGDNSMLEWFRSNDFETNMPNWIKEPKYADLNTSGSGAVGKAMLSIMSLKKAKDFWDDSYQVGHQNNDDLHHIFPKAALKRKLMRDRGITSEEASKAIKSEFNVDSKLNLTFLKSGTNRIAIVDKDPKDYFSEIIESKHTEAAKTAFKESLKSHLIDEKCLEALLQNDFVKFIEARRKLFKSEFETLGVRNFSDTELED